MVVSLKSGRLFQSTRFPPWHGGGSLWKLGHPQSWKGCWLVLEKPAACESQCNQRVLGFLWLNIALWKRLLVTSRFLSFKDNKIRKLGTHSNLWQLLCAGWTLSMRNDLNKVLATFLQFWKQVTSLLSTNFKISVFLNIVLFLIYFCFWLCWVCIAVCAFSSCREWGLLLISVASLVEQGL